MLYSNNKMPPYLAEIPYGFKNLWRITVSALSLDPPQISAEDIISINLNGSEVQLVQLVQLYDYNRDVCSISQEDGGGILATLAGYDKTSQLITYHPLVEQEVSINGVTSVTGDMVDNSSPQNPVIGHDAQKLDVTDYEADKTVTDGAISALQLAQGADASAIAALQNNMVQGATVNGGEIIHPVGGILPITVEQLLPEDVRDAITAKVDKTIGDASGNITQDATLSASNGILTFTEKRVNTSNSQVSTQTNSINLREQLGIPALEAIDTRLFYFTDDANVSAYDEEITVARTSLYRRNANGTTYTPTTTDRISVVYSVAPEFSAVGVEASRNIAAVGIVVSSTVTALTVVFRRLRQYEIYNKFNGYRAGTLVYDSVAHGVFAVTQDVPRPTTVLTIIPLTNEQYYDPIVDKSLMPAMTVFGNFNDSDDAGEAYTLDETRLALMRGDLSQYCGYDNYVEFLGDDVPESILTNNDWSTNVSLWVTDGIRFTSFSALLEYLSNFSSTSRFKISNRGIISTSYEDGGINIETIFGVEEIAAQLDAVYMPPVEDAVEGNIPIFTEGGLVEDSGSSLDDFATAAQGAKADSAVQAVTISQGTANGTIKVSITAGGVTTTTDNVPVKGLNTAAYATIVSFATAAQGAKADTAVQSVSLAEGDTNGTVSLTVDGETDEVSVHGLGSAAFTSSSTYATAAQGLEADTALQPANVVDGLTSSETDKPLSANQGRILSQRIAAISSAGRPIGGFATYADAYTNTDDFADDLQPIEVGNVIYIAADENHTNQSAEYTVSSIGADGAIVYAFSRIVPASNRDFTLNPITSAEISAGAVTGNALATNAVNASKIADGSIGLAKLDSALQSAIGNDTDAVKTPLISTGSGNVVAGVSLDSNNRLNVSKVSAITGVIVNGSGFVTSATVDGLGNLVLTADGTAAGTVTVEGEGNVVANIETSGTDIVATKGYAVTQSVNSGSGNVLSGASINNGVITFTKVNASSLIPNASTSQAGKVQLNNTLASTSTSQALTAAQGKALADTINAGNATVVHLAGSETITGAKTFSTHPTVPAKTVVPSNPSATQYATEAQVGTRYGKVNGATQGNLTAFGADSLADSGIPAQSVSSHLSDASIHVTPEDKARWNANQGGGLSKQYIDYTASGTTVAYMPIERPTISTKIEAGQNGGGLPSPTNIRTFIPVSSATLRVNSTDYSKSFAAPVYRGSYDWSTGKLTETFKAVALVGTETFTQSTSAGRTTFEYRLETNDKPDGKPTGLSRCTHFGAATGGYSHGYNLCGLSSNGKSYIISYDGTLAQFKAYLAAQNSAGTPVTFEYELASTVETTGTASEIVYTEDVENTATGTGIITVSGKMNPDYLLGSAGRIGGKGALTGKTAVFMGDSLIGNYQPPYDYPSYVAEYTGLRVINAGFGGCRMALSSSRPALSMAALAAAISQNNWDSIRTAVSAGGQYVINYWNTSYNYALDKVNLLAGIDWGTVDYIVVGYGTNDWSGNIPLEDDENPNYSVLGAMRYAIEKITARYPHIKLMFVSPPWRWWDRNTDGGNTSGTGDNYEDAETRANGYGKYLWEYIVEMAKVAAAYHIPYFDMYHSCGFNKENRYEYFNLYDGTHPYQYKGGYEMMGRLVAGFLLSPSSMAIPSEGGGGSGGDYPPTGGIPKTDLASSVRNSLDKADSAYQKPAGNIPATDLASSVQLSLGKADTAVQPAALASYQTTAITDAGGYFVVDTVEGALQSLGAELAGVNALVGGGL